MFDRQAILDQLSQAGIDPARLGQLAQSLPQVVGPEHLQQFGIDPSNIAGSIGNLAGNIPGLGDVVNNLPGNLGGLVPGFGQQAPAADAAPAQGSDQVQGSDQAQGFGQDQAGTGGQDQGFGEQAQNIGEQAQDWARDQPVADPFA